MHCALQPRRNRRSGTADSAVIVPVRDMIGGANTLPWGEGRIAEGDPGWADGEG
jgi:hypothetical protein